METAETINYTLFFDDGIGLIDVAKKLLRYIPKKFVIIISRYGYINIYILDRNRKCRLRTTTKTKMGTLYAPS